MVLATGFQTTPIEMEAVENLFVHDDDGFVDYNELVLALLPVRDVSFLLFSLITWNIINSKYSGLEILF